MRKRCHGSFIILHIMMLSTIEKYIRNEANGLLTHIIEWKQFILELVAYLYALIGIESKLDFSSPPKSPTNTDLTLR
jgi:hypothetical protein